MLLFVIFTTIKCCDIHFIQIDINIIYLFILFYVYFCIYCLLNVFAPIFLTNTVRVDYFYESYTAF